MTVFSLANVVQQLTQSFKAAVPLVTNAGGIRPGGFVNPAYGTDDAAQTGTGAIVNAALALYIAPGPRQKDPALLELINDACTYWKSVQRESGRIDLRSCNYDSGPDTAFVVQGLCMAIKAVRSPAECDDELRTTLDILEGVTKSMARGLKDGGFHTPNHRWVIASALTQAIALWNDLGPELADVRDAYLAEGPDIDEEGFFIERSIAVYDAICDRSLLHIDENRPWPAGRKAAFSNLATALDLLHPDGTAETGLSHRQDHGTRQIPGGLLPVLLQASRASGDAHWSSHAAWLWQCGAPLKLDDGARTVFELLAGAPIRPPEPPPSIASFRPLNRLWRIRKGSYSLSVFGETTHLATLAWGSATLAQISAGQSYVGQGQFVPDTMTGDAEGVVLRYAGRSGPHPPGYWFPLGVAVKKEAFTDSLAKRGQRRIPEPAARMELMRVGGALSLRYISETGLDDVTAQIAFDFPPGGVWETDDTIFKPLAGQVIFLRKGSGTMRFGNDKITIDGGSDSHRTWLIRDAPCVPPGLCRVLVPLLTPFDHQVTITCS